MGISEESELSLRNEDAFLFKHCCTLVGKYQEELENPDERRIGRVISELGSGLLRLHKAGFQEEEGIVGDGSVFTTEEIRQGKIETPLAIDAVVCMISNSKFGGVVVYKHTLGLQVINEFLRKTLEKRLDNDLLEPYQCVERYLESFKNNRHLSRIIQEKDSTRILEACLREAARGYNDSASRYAEEREGNRWLAIGGMSYLRRGLRKAYSRNLANYLRKECYFLPDFRMVEFGKSGRIYLTKKGIPEFIE